MKKYYEGAPLYSNLTYYAIRIIFLVVYLVICILSVLFSIPNIPWYINIAGVTVVFIALGSTDWKEILRTYESYKQKWEDDNRK